MEDSLEVREMIKRVLEGVLDMAVVGETAGRQPASELIHALAPDVVVIGPSPDKDEAVAMIADSVDTQPSLIAVSVRLSQSPLERQAFVKAGVFTPLDYSEMGRLPESIRRADQIQQEVRSITARPI